MITKAIIPAGGSSSRYKGNNKLLEILNDKPVIMRSIEAIKAIKDIQEIIIPSSEELIPILTELTNSMDNIKIVKGGKCRQESVYNALKECGECDFVVIHDGARPLINPEIIKRCLSVAHFKKAAIVAVKAIDTIKKVDQDNKIIETPDRTYLWNVQTPQIFDYNLIFDAHKKLEGKNFSDDAGMLESLGEDVYVVEGEYTNFKITTKTDLTLAQLYLNEQTK